MTDSEILERVRQVVQGYEGFAVDAPEDGWRFERDLRDVLGMPGVEY